MDPKTPHWFDDPDSIDDMAHGPAEKFQSIYDKV